MKSLHILFITILFIVVACSDGYIDDITRVDAGPDESAPVVSINYPLNGTLIRVTEDVTTLNIRFEVVDDIEIQTISVLLNGAQIAQFNDFKDYRRALKEYPYDALTNGEHTLTITATDLSGKSTSQSVSFEKVEPYQPVYDGEIFYLPFDGDYTELVTITNATQVGSPGFADDNIAGGKSYAGASEAYLRFPTSILQLGDEFSAAFWYKVNAAPDRAGILVIGPPDPNNPNAMNNRTKGFRLFRENAGGMQRVKLNVGNGTSDGWFDGGAAADIDPGDGDWTHIAFTISNTQCVVYLNGQIVSQGAFAGISWADCDILTIASGAPRFTEWGHLSDQSLFDELRIFNKALTQEEIQDIIDAEL